MKKIRKFAKRKALLRAASPVVDGLHGCELHATLSGELLVTFVFAGPVAAGWADA